MSNVKTRGKQGFTLVEIIIVVAIIAILAALAVPNLIGQLQRGKEARLTSDADELCKYLLYAMSQEAVDGTTQIHTTLSNPTLTDSDVLAAYNLAIGIMPDMAPSLRNNVSDVAKCIGRSPSAPIEVNINQVIAVAATL